MLREKALVEEIIGNTSPEVKHSSEYPDYEAEPFFADNLLFAYLPVTTFLP